MKTINLSLDESAFVCNILADMFGPELKPIIVSDSSSAIDIIHNPGATKRSVMFERNLFVARECYLNGSAKFVLCPDAKMMADFMTKVTDKLKFFDCRRFTMNHHD